MGISFNELMSPANDFLDVIAPSDTEDLPFLIRSIRVHGSAGDIIVITESGSTRVFHNVQLGEITMPVVITRVLTTGTTAVGMEGY